MSSLDDLKRAIPDLHDLADKLGVKRDGAIKGGKAVYFRPSKPNESNASLSIYEEGWKWKDFAEDIGGGSAVGFFCYVRGLDTEREDDWKAAVDELRKMYNCPWEPKKRDPDAPRPERSKEDFIADQCLKTPAPAAEYLTTRGIPADIAQRAIASKSLGFNDWTSDRLQPGEKGYGGPAAAFLVRDPLTSGVVAIDFRYTTPEVNGGLKTKTQGEKHGRPWVLDWRAVKSARKLVIVESAINALAVEACKHPGTAAVAIRGTGNAGNIDWRFAQGKFCLIAMDADLPDDAGNRPGAKAAWAVYDALTALNIACLMVDQDEWYADGLNDIADIAKDKGIEELSQRLKRIEPWAIPGLHGKDGPKGKQRLYLPGHDFAVYWRFRVKEDFTSFITIKEVEGPDGKQEEIRFEDVCGFRIASVSRVTIQSATATMSGEADAQPVTVFAVSVQVPRHGAQLIRRVLDDERLHNVDQWKKFGPIFSPSRFQRLVNVLERTADCGAREAVNFVGLCWRNGKLALNEGPDCYFTDPEKQCPYHNLLLPSGPQRDAGTVIGAYQGTFKDNAALQLLTWALGAHLKAILGFWPHMVLQAKKGSGKSTLVKRLERSIGMTMFGGQSLQTEFRLLTSVSYTSHPVGWEELSARKIEVIDKAVAMLQECYQFTVTRRGSEMTEFLQCAPVLLAGEDVPVRSLTGKVVQSDISLRMGPPLPEGLPRFPVREWVQYLSELDPASVRQRLEKATAYMWEGCRARQTDTGAKRMVANYAAVALAWSLLADFAGIAREQGEFLPDLRTQMNKHIAETIGDREPFVWILELLVSEIDAGRFVHPHVFDDIDGQQCLLVRPSDVMAHISTEPRLREQWNGLTVKSSRAFKAQLIDAEIIVKEHVDKIIRRKRCAHMTALSLDAMQSYGVNVSVPEESEQFDGYGRAANG